MAVLGKLPKALVETFAAAERPAVIVGGGALKFDGVHGAALALIETLGLIKTGWNGFNVLHMAAARMGGLMLGYAQAGGIAALRDARLVFALGADEVDWSAFTGFKVYIGHHGDAGAAAADVVLPAASHAEKPGTYVNLEGRVQRSERAVFPPGDAREDWAILRALSDALGHRLPFDSFDALRELMFTQVPALRSEGLARIPWALPKLPAKPSGTMTGYPIADFYLTNAICRASPTMHACSAEITHGNVMLEAAE